MDNMTDNFKEIRKAADLSIFFKSEKVNEKSIQYFTGVKSDAAVLVVYSKKVVLYVSSLEEKRSVKGVVVKDFNLKKIFSDIASVRPKKIGFNNSEISVKSFDFFKKKIVEARKGKKSKVKFVDVSNFVNSAREIKTESEVSKIRMAVSITEDILEDCIYNFRKFKTENEVVEFLLKSCIAHGVESAFDPIVASGKNSANPHYFPKSGSKLNKGFCVIDFGVKYQGYCSDMTRTIYIGKASDTEKEVYGCVLGQLLKLEKNLKAGVTKVALDFKMIHSPGHGIGLDVHELPGIGRDELKAGAVIAVEPGLYYKGKYGIRIEDDYIVSSTGLIKISKMIRELIEIR